MKKLTRLSARQVLPIILLLTVAFFSPQKVNAQTDSECFREYQAKEYKCLQKFNDCTKTCTSLGSVEAYKPCANNCSAQDKTCSEQASADLTACKAAIKKDKENPAETKESPEVETNTDCHGAFTKESNSCLKENATCINSCVEKGNAAMSLTVDGAKVSLECQRNVCDPASETCNNKAKANFKACQDVRKAGENSQKENPQQEEFSLLKFFGVNPFETWLRVQNLSKLPEAIFGFADALYFSSESVDIDYEPGMASIEVDSTSLFGADLTVTSRGEVSGVQIRTPDQSEYKDLKPNQNIPHDAYIRTDKPIRFEIAGELIDVRPREETVQVEFQIKKSKKNESVDIINTPGSKTSVRLAEFVDQQRQPAIAENIDRDAWMMPVAKKESVVDVPGASGIKRYSWDTDSGAVIKSSDWKQTEIKPVVKSDDFITREVKFNQGELEVKVRNNKPAENQFGVDAGWLGVTVSRTHFWVSKSQDKKMAVIGVYEGEVEVKTRDGKIVKVSPDGDPSTGSGQVKPGVAVVSQKLSPVKLALIGLVLAAAVGGVVWFIKKKTSIRPSKKR